MIARAIVMSSLLLAACGYGPSTTVACNDYAQALCDAHARCTGGTYYPRTFADRATCVRRTQLGCTLNASAQDNNEHQPLSLEACVRAIVDPTFSCEDLSDGTFPAVCHTPGSRPNGATCGVDGQCQTNYCSGLKTQACGTCTPAPTPGTSCLTTNCASGQICQIPEQQCAVPIEAGDACQSGGAPCGYGLVCTASSTSTNGTCVAQTATLGESCLSEHCEGAYALYCNTSTRTCDLLQFVDENEPCGTLGNGASAACEGGGSCYLANDGGLVQAGQMGTCKDAAADGAACDTVLGPPCTAPARCVLTASGATVGTCTLPDPSACD